MIKIDVFIQVAPDKEVCVGQALERDEAIRLALKARKTRHNKVKTSFVYGLTSLEGVQLFFKPISVNDEQLKHISKTYTKGIVYATYGK
jgi:fibronectin type 3 domain-containing protein